LNQHLFLYVRWRMKMTMHIFAMTARIERTHTQTCDASAICVKAR